MQTFRLLLVILILKVSIFASIGKISTVSGEASIIRGQNVIKAVSGATLEQKDTIKAAKGSAAQIVFDDNTVITVGGGTTFKIEEYLFDQKNPNARFRVEEGSFKTITGKIGKIAPDKFKMETKTATLGIRGTIFMGHIDSNGNLKVACMYGAITVTPNMPDTKITPTLVKAGEMTEADKTGVKTPQSYTPSELKELGKELGIYAKRENNLQEIIKNDITTVANDTKNKTDETASSILNAQTNDLVKQASTGSSGGSGSTPGYWSAAGYSSDYVPGTTYNMKGHEIDEGVGLGMLNMDVDFTTQMSTIKWGDPATTPVIQSPSVFQASASGEDSFQVKQEGYDYGVPYTFTVTTRSDSNGADYVSWGYWTKTNDSTGAVDRGVWIAGIPTVSMPTSSSATYNGSIIGNTKDSGGVISQITTGTANFNVNFGATYSMTGSLAFANANGQSWNASVSGSGFSGNSFSMNNSNITGTGGSINIINGSFYGPNAATLGGAFWLTNANNDNAVGVFKAAKQ
ncbi:MAG: transferrin-binding protein-like solute binding protein [Campylobacterales bacterium]